MPLLWIVVVVLVVLALAGLPTWYGPHYSYGYWPSGLLGLIVLLVVIWLLAGRF